jgi:hypothetical protein
MLVTTRPFYLRPAMADVDCPLWIVLPAPTWRYGQRIGLPPVTAIRAPEM